MKYPEEFELLSIFECEPIRADKDVPFFYNSSLFRYRNEDDETYEFRMLPSYNEVFLKVAKRDYDIALLKLQNIEALSILSDNKVEKRIMLTTTRAVIKIQMKPSFRIEYTDEVII